MNDWDPRENPLVQRAFRVGFRRGPTGFKTGWWLAGLGLATLGPFAFHAISVSWTMKDTARWMLVGLMLVTGLIFVIGGFQRMLVSFTRERERGTFEFLHLSTLRSSAIVLGFLMAGQLPGYLVLVLVFPVLAVCALYIGFPLVTLLAVVASLVFYVLVLSVFFLFFGHWSKKSAELRGAALVYTALYAFLGFIAAQGLTQSGKLPPGTVEVLLGFPVVSGLFSHGMAVARSSTLTSSPVVPPQYDPSFFGVDVPQWILGVLVLGIPTIVVFLAVSRALRHQDRNPWAEPHAIVLMAWALICLLGVWHGTDIEHGDRVIVLAVVGWIGLRRFTERNTPGRTRTVHALGRNEGSFRRLIRNPDQGPPVRLALALLGLWIAASIGLTVLSSFDGSEITPLGTGAAPLAGLVVWSLCPLLFVLPFLSLSLLRQWLSWRIPSWGLLVPWISLFAVWVPFVVFLSRETLASMVPEVLVRAYAAFSPFSQVEGLLASGQGGPPASGWILFGQVPYLVVVVLLSSWIRTTAGQLSARSRGLLEAPRAKRGEAGDVAAAESA